MKQPTEDQSKVLFPAFPHRDRYPFYPYRSVVGHFTLTLSRCAGTPHSPVTLLSPRLPAYLLARSITALHPNPALCAVISVLVRNPSQSLYICPPSLAYHPCIPTPRNPSNLTATREIWVAYLPACLPVYRSHRTRPLRSSIGDSGEYSSHVRASSTLYDRR